MDHEALLTSIRTVVAESEARLRVTDCLGPCAHANVVAVRRGPERLWFGNLLGHAITESLAEWAAGGARGDVPPELEIFRFNPDHEHVDP
ncbi:MAG: hypothetical protein AAF962_26285 [Actinomycetota bacterium]